MNCLKQNILWAATICLLITTGCGGGLSGSYDSNTPPTSSNTTQANVTRYNVSGNVLSNNGLFMEASVSLVGLDVNITTNTNGYFNFSGLQNGTYVITVSKAGFIFFPTTQRIIITDKDFVCQPFVGAATSLTPENVTVNGSISPVVAPIVPITDTKEPTGSLAITLNFPIASPPITKKIDIVAATSIETGSKTTFTANITGITNNNVIWSVVEPNGGSITSTGIYTAPYQTGTYTIMGISSADGSIFATKTITISASTYPPGYDSSTKPGVNFNLSSSWQIQQPDGNIISPKNAASQYISKWFYTDKNDEKNITFWVPPTGTPLIGSSYCRSEMLEFNNNSFEGWSYIQGMTNKMAVTGKVVMAPSSHTAIGQILQHSTSKPLLELFYYNNGDVKAFVPYAVPPQLKETFLTNVPVGSKYTFLLDLSNGGPIKITINGTVYDIQVPSGFGANNMLFKVGNYDQSCRSGSLSETYTGTGSIVKIYDLLSTHLIR